MKPETKTEPEEKPKRVPCLHDPRKFLNVMPQPYAINGDARRRLLAAEFFPTCPNFSMAGSIYCVPHTVMNTAPAAMPLEVRKAVDYYIARAIPFYSEGWMIVNPVMGRMVKPSWWPHRFDSFGPYGKPRG